MADDTAVADDAAVTDDAVTDEPIVSDDDWKTKARKHERALQRERQAREAAEAKLAEHADASKTETERALEQARKEAADAAKAEVAQSYQERILNAEIRAQAAGKFANPKLAAKLLDLDLDDAFGEDGDVNSEYIGDVIDEFLKADENAGLRAAALARSTTGDADAGRGTPAATGDMNDFIRAGIKKRT